VIDKEIREQAEALAEEFARDFVNRRNNDRIDHEFVRSTTERRLLIVLSYFHDMVHRIADRAERKTVRGYFNTTAAGWYRRHNIKTDTWTLADDCDVCGGDIEDKHALSLSLGSWRVHAKFDMCRACTLRLIQQLEARIDDRRYRENKEQRA
jgi:hypothetical protein